MRDFPQILCIFDIVTSALSHFYNLFESVSLNQSYTNALLQSTSTILIYFFYASGIEDLGAPSFWPVCQKNFYTIRQ
jgi:hypothetical protein